MELPIMGAVSTAFLFRPAHGDEGQCERLFVATSDHALVVLALDPQTGQLRARNVGECADAVGEPSERGPLVAMDPSCRMVALHLYTWLLKLVPVDVHGQLQDAFNVRLPDGLVVALCWLRPDTAHAPPVLAYLCQDGEVRRLRTHVVQHKEKALAAGPLADTVVERGASLLAAVGRGVLVWGESGVAWHGPNGQTVQAAYPVRRPTCMLAHCAIDADGSRHLSGDDSGRLWLVVCAGAAGGTVAHVQVELLGVTSVAATLTYLDAGLVYVGGAYGDSQLVRLLPERDADTGLQLELLAAHANVGPVVDLCAVDVDGAGLQTQLVTCSGALKDGSLRVVRNGIGVSVEAELDLPNIVGLWSMKAQTADVHDRYLAVSFATQTVFLALVDDELAECEQLGGLEDGARTLHCATVIGDQVVQVTGSAVRLCAAASLALADTWAPPEGTRITVAAGDASHVVAVVGGSTVVLLRVEGQRLLEAARTRLEHEVACADVAAGRVLVGLWGAVAVRVLAADAGLACVCNEPLPGAVVPRSVRLCRMEGAWRVLVGLGDGQLVHYVMDEQGALREHKQVALGTTAVQLSVFSDAHGGADSVHVFAGCDRPAVVYGRNARLAYSNVNVHNVAVCARFHTPSFPGCLALATDSQLMVGSLDAIQRLHLRAVPLDAMARRVVHHQRTYVVGCSLAESLADAVEATAQSQLRVLDDVSYAALATLALQPDEAVCSLASVELRAAPDGTSRALVVCGTAFVVAGENEASRGRLLCLRVVRDGAGGDGAEDHGVARLQLVAERVCPGAVYSVAQFSEGRLVASCNARVEVLQLLRDDASDAWKLQTVAEHTGQVMALFVRAHGDFVAVGDLMRSCALLRLDSVSGRLEVAARDYRALWVTALAALSEELLVVADNELGLVVMRRTGERLEHAASFRLGELCTCLVRGRLVAPDPQLPPAQVPPPSLLWGGTNGTLGALQPITAEQYAWLRELEQAMAARCPSVGSLKVSASCCCCC